MQDVSKFAIILTLAPKRMSSGLHMYIKNNNSTSSDESSDNVVSLTQVRRRRSSRRNTIGIDYSLLLSPRLVSEPPKHPQIAQIQDS